MSFLALAYAECKVAWRRCAPGGGVRRSRAISTGLATMRAGRRREEEPDDQHGPGDDARRAAA